MQLGKLGTHKCQSGSRMTFPVGRHVQGSYPDDPVIRSIAGDEVGADEFAVAFDAFSASVNRQGT